MFWLWQLSSTICTSLCSSRDSVKNLASAANGSGTSVASASRLNVGHCDVMGEEGGGDGILLRAWRGAQKPQLGGGGSCPPRTGMPSWRKGIGTGAQPSPAVGMRWEALKGSGLVLVQNRLRMDGKGEWMRREGELPAPHWNHFQDVPAAAGLWGGQGVSAGIPGGVNPHCIPR